MNMNFDYPSYQLMSPDSQTGPLVHRPEIELILLGPANGILCQGLVDTGADNTVFPSSLARRLRIPLIAEPGPPAKGFGGQELAMFSGEVRLGLQSEDEVCHWRTRVLFFDFPHPDDEAVVLGQAGFLEYFTATFDGQRKTLQLAANDQLPASET
jgi:hypothetical protein